MPERAFAELGESLTKALIGGDFALYRSMFLLPVRFAPRDGKAYVLTSDAALHEDFALYVSIIRLHGVTDIYRRLLGWESLADAAAQVNWTTHILVRARLLAEPFQTRMTLREVDGAWRITGIESSEGHLNWTLGKASVSPAGKFELKSGDA